MALRNFKDAVIRDTTCAMSDLVRNRSIQGISLFQSKEEEQLSEGTFRSYKGFLMRSFVAVQESIIDSSFLEQEVYHL